MSVFYVGINGTNMRTIKMVSSNHIFSPLPINLKQLIKKENAMNHECIMVTGSPEPQTKQKLDLCIV